MAGRHAEEAGAELAALREEASQRVAAAEARGRDAMDALLQVSTGRAPVSLGART